MAQTRAVAREPPHARQISKAHLKAEEWAAAADAATEALNMDSASVRVARAEFLDNHPAL